MMIKSDEGIVIIMLLLVLLYLSVWAMGYFIHKLPHFISTLNIATVLVLLGYLAIRQLQVQQYHFELREMIVLGIEVFIFFAAIYAITSGNKYKWITTKQYVVFGIHLLLLLLGLVFMFTFKINKLM
jgi:hypothetical protein